MNSLTMLLLMPLWIILCMAAHETGHYLAAKKLGLNPFVGFDRKGVYIGHKYTNKKNHMLVTRSGVLTGYAPLIIPLIINTTYGTYMILAWTIGNVREIKKLIENK